LVLAYLGIIIVYAFFRKYQETFMSSSRIGAFLSYIGRRTLDIYMLHYFFLPKLPELGDWLKSCPNLAIELVLVLLLSIVVIGISLITSNIIRVSDTLAYYLFGKRKTI
jgi:fucose 4-O-acetylase-like acetyltransferase